MYTIAIVEDDRHYQAQLEQYINEYAKGLPHKQEACKSHGIT